MKNALKNDLKKLLGLIGVSGAEQEVGRYVIERLSAVCDRVEVTDMGVVLGSIDRKRPGKKAMIAAHLDEVGLIIKNITQDGFLAFEKVGDFSDKMLPARKIWIQGSKGRIPGIIGMRPAHIMTAEDLKTIQPAEQLYIDVGAHSASEVYAYGIRLGDSAVLQSDYMEMANTDLICSRAIDDRIGCAVILNLMERIDREKLEGTLVAAFSVIEETTIEGLISSVNLVRPDYVIAIDTVPCGDVLDVDTDLELPIYMDRGPVLILAQGDPAAQKFSRMHPMLQKALEDVAAGLGIDTQQLVLSGKYYISDAVGMHLAGSGTPSATLAIPRRYSHTPIELLNINDAVKTWTVLKQFIEEKNGTIDLSFYGTTHKE